MGCDIHPFAEVRKNGKWIRVTDEVFRHGEGDAKYYGKEKGDTPFDFRNYGMFGFLADVRNYSHCETIVPPRGLPSDSEYLNEVETDNWGTKTTRREDADSSDYHSQSYVTLAELLAWDYDKTFWNRRVTKQTGPNFFDGAALAEEGEGTTETYREFLGPLFFIHLEDLATLGKPEDVRVVFYFDN